MKQEFDRSLNIDGRENIQDNYPGDPSTPAQQNQTDQTTKEDHHTQTDETTERGANTMQNNVVKDQPTADAEAEYINNNEVKGSSLAIEPRNLSPERTALFPTTPFHVIDGNRRSRRISVGNVTKCRITLPEKKG